MLQMKNKMLTKIHDTRHKPSIVRVLAILADVIMVKSFLCAIPNVKKNNIIAM